MISKTLRRRSGRAAEGSEGSEARRQPLGRAATIMRRVALVGLLAGSGGLVAATTASAATFTWCDSCLMPQASAKESGVAIRPSRLYAHNLGGGDREVGVLLSGGTVYNDINTVYHDYQVQTSYYVYCLNGSSYNVRMDCHATVPDT